MARKKPILPAVVPALLMLACCATPNANQPTRIAQREDGAYRVIHRGQELQIQGAKITPIDVDFYLKELAGAGANAVMMSLEALERTDHHPLPALVLLRIGKYRAGFDYGDPAQVAAQKERIRQEALKHKDHPALMMWSVGNEPGIGVPGEKIKLAFQAINDLAAMIKEIDGKHPVIVTLGSGVRRRQLEDLDRLCPALDAVGFNVYYRDIPTLREDLDQKGWTRPFLLTEFGPTGHWQAPKTPWGIPMEETSTEKAENYIDAWRTVTADPRCLGGFAFLWLGPRHEKTHTWYNMFLFDRSRLGPVEAMQFLWTGRWPENRAPRIGPGRLKAGLEPDAVSPEPMVAPPGVKLHAEVEASDPDGDALSYEWDLRVDVADDPNVGGDREEPTSPIENVLLSSEENRAVIQLPDEVSNYRLFVYVRDGRGAAATANIPLRADTRGER